MRFRLGAHQRYAEAMMEANPSLGIFYEAGTGKTMIALSRAYHALERGEIDSVLVVCPASLTGSWRLSVDRMLQFEGYTEEGVERLRSALTIVSYQKTYRTERVPARNGGEGAVRRVVRLRDEVDRRWGMVIVDEAHGLGGHASIQTKACMTLARLADYRYALTGTPVSGGGGKPDYKKLYGIIQFLEPDTWRSWSEFVRRYVVATDQWHNPSRYDDAACEELMREHAIQMRLADCFDMPSEVEEDVPCELAEHKVYRDLDTGREREYGLDFEMGGAKYPRLLQVCSGSLRVPRDDGTVDTRILKCSKDAALESLLQGTDDAVVVFCEYTASVDRAAEICRKAGRKTVVYDGRSDPDAWTGFQHGDATAIVCQYQKGGVGIDLYKSATTVYFEPCWSFLQFEQSKARTMRKGQTRTCRYVYLCTPGTREADAWRLVRKGLSLTQDVFRRWAEEDNLT